MTAASGLAPPPGAAPPPAGACWPAAGPSPATSSRCGRADRVFGDAQAPPPPPFPSDPERRSERERQSSGPRSCVHLVRRPRCPEPRYFPGKRGSPKSAVLGPCRLSGLSARLLAWPGRRCGGVRHRRPSAWSGGSPRPAVLLLPRRPPTRAAAGLGRLGASAGTKEAPAAAPAQLRLRSDPLRPAAAASQLFPEASARPTARRRAPASCSLVHPGPAG